MKPSSSTIILRKARIALTPSSSLLWSQLENGSVIAGYNREGYGGRGVYLHRDWIEPELAALQHFLKPGFVFVDIGANVGVYTLKAAKEVGDSGVVIAAEAFIETACRLQKNIRANRYRNVRVRNVCVGGETKPALLYLNNGKPNSYGLLQSNQAESVSVMSVSLDDLCRWEGLQRLDYLKIDAEGAESAILHGAAAVLARFRPIVQVETTRNETKLPDGYRRFHAQGSPNDVFISKEADETITQAVALKWNEMNQQSSK
jgi:FkbM family methyltransferase